MATEIEAQTVRWIAELIGFPADGDGLLVSGGTMANFVCFLAARAAKAPTCGRWDCAETGAPLRVYASTETHTWIQKAADMFGLGTDAIRWIDVDAEQRMDVAALERADRRRPRERRAAVPGRRHRRHRQHRRRRSAGGDRRGLPAPRHLVPRGRRVRSARGARAGAPESLRALSEADSVAVDPHKWLYAPVEAGCALVRRRGDLRRAFSYHPSYYHFDDEVTNYFDYGPQNSRGFRALKVWLALRQVGWSGYQQMIGEDMRLSRQLHARVHGASGLRGADAAPQHHDVPLRPGATCS